MRALFFLPAFVVCFSTLSQSYTFPPPIGHVVSLNGEYRAESIPFDTQVGTDRGKTNIYRGNILLRTIPRSFDLTKGLGYMIYLSNNGDVLVYFSPRIQNDNGEKGHVFVYKRKDKAKVYTVGEFLACDIYHESCGIEKDGTFYSTNFFNRDPKLYGLDQKLLILDLN